MSSSQETSSSAQIIESLLLRVLERMDRLEAKVERLAKEKNVIVDEDSERDFEAFWAAYPKKVGKEKSLKVWTSMRKAGILPSVAVILEAAQLYTKVKKGKEPKYIHNPVNWLDGKHWNDELAVNSGSEQQMRRL